MTGPLGNISYYEEATPRSREEYQSLLAQANNPQQQTPIPTLGQQAPQQTPVPNMGESLGIDAQEQIKQNNLGYEQKYNAANPFWTVAKNLTADDWKDVGVESLKGVGLGAEKMSDAMTLGIPSLIDKHTGGNFAQRNQQYYQQAQESGVGDLAKLNDRIIDTVGGTSKLAKFLTSSLSPSTKIGGYVLGDSGISGITAANRSGNTLDVQAYANGAIDSNSIQLLEYLKKMGWL